MSDTAPILGDHPRAPSPRLAVNQDLAVRFAQRCESVGVNASDYLNTEMRRFLSRYDATPFAPSAAGRSIGVALKLAPETFNALMRECEQRKCEPAALVGLLIADLYSDRH